MTNIHAHSVGPKICVAADVLLTVHDQTRRVALSQGAFTILISTAGVRTTYKQKGKRVSKGSQIAEGFYPSV
jgi:hypothetical protein